MLAYTESDESVFVYDGDLEGSVLKSSLKHIRGITRRGEVIGYVSKKQKITEEEIDDMDKRYLHSMQRKRAHDVLNLLTLPVFYCQFMDKHGDKLQKEMGDLPDKIRNVLVK